MAYLTSPDWIRCDDLPVAIEILPDDVKAGSTKPYLLAGGSIESAHRALYCHSAAPAFVPDPMRRMLGR